MLIKYALLILVVLIVIGASIVRLQPIAAIDYQFEQLQPLISKEQPGQFSVGIEGDLEPVVFEGESPREVAARLKEIIETTPRTTLLIGWLTRDVEQDVYNASYVTRSAIWSFPDVTSVRVERAAGGAAVLMHGRLVFGKHDFGVNGKRIRGWLGQLTQ